MKLIFDCDHAGLLCLPDTIVLATSIKYLAEFIGKSEKVIYLPKLCLRIAEDIPATSHRGVLLLWSLENKVFSALVEVGN